MVIYLGYDPPMTRKALNRTGTVLITAGFILWAYGFVFGTFWYANANPSRLEPVRLWVSDYTQTSIRPGILEEVFRGRTLEEWKPRLKGIPFDAVQTLTEAVSDPQARANDMFVSFDHPTYGPTEMVASPINLGATPAAIRRPAPEFGQHTEEVLLEFGYTWQEILRLKEQGVIA